MKRLSFNDEMMKAWLDGRKTVTRRLMKPQPDKWTDMPRFTYGKGHSGEGWYMADEEYQDEGAIILKPPYLTGETVFIAETWQAYAGKYCCCAYYGGHECKCDKILYRADPSTDFANGCEYPADRMPWKSPVTMPEWASRSKAIIKSVRPERIQEITTSECVKEGLIWKDVMQTLDDAGNDEIKERFAQLWDSLYPYSWERNDWCWRYGLERVG